MNEIPNFLVISFPPIFPNSTQTHYFVVGGAKTKIFGFTLKRINLFLYFNK